MASGKKSPLNCIPKTGVEKETIELVTFDLWIKAYSYRAIQAALADQGISVSVSTVSSYIKKFIKEHKAERLEALDDQKRTELMKLDRLEQVYWAAWEQSVGIFVSRSYGGWEKGIEGAKGAGVKKLSINIEDNIISDSAKAAARNSKENKKYVNITETASVGDVRFLMGVERCIEKRCKLLGLDAPIVIEDKTRKRVSRVINISVHGSKD